jgi:hypothetical protein
MSDSLMFKDLIAPTASPTPVLTKIELHPSALVRLLADIPPTQTGLHNLHGLPLYEDANLPAWMGRMHFSDGRRRLFVCPESWKQPPVAPTAGSQET